MGLEKFFILIFRDVQFELAPAVDCCSQVPKANPTRLGSQQQLVVIRQKTHLPNLVLLLLRALLPREFLEVEEVVEVCDLDEWLFGLLS